jgi:hypothetical protein
LRLWWNTTTPVYKAAYVINALNDPVTDVLESVPTERKHEEFTVSTNRRSLGQYSSLADSGHGVCEGEAVVSVVHISKAE